MTIVTDLPRATRLIENTWIPMSDGCRLAARIWLPEDADQDPVPAILNFIPYRKNENGARDAPSHRYVAGHGYAFVRVDLRGTGDSDGILLGEYLKQEQDDGMEVLAWLADQPWCTGNVGMIGISWGGFNGLQIAARRPPELKAVMSVCSTDDRYVDEFHHQGGCVMDFTLHWSSSMFAFNARPPDPVNVGDRWREMWFDRMENSKPWIEEWLRHPHKDDFWKHGSVSEDYDAIQCPVYMVGGWADPYTGVIPRFLAGYSGPRKGLIGPWAHQFPEDGSPGPAIDFLGESLRWWDRWLKGVDTGIMDEPMLKIWMQDAVPPQSDYDERPGRWIAERDWPSPNCVTRTFFLNDGTLDAEAANEARLDIVGSQRAGKDAGNWAGFGPDYPSDQREEDGLSLTFTSPPLEAPMEVLGSPRANLIVSSDRPNALLVARLCDIAPTGSSMLISRRLLNLTHRDSDEQPAPLEPGRRHEVTVPLDMAGYSVPAGHRLRLSISPTYWPWAWPSPEPVTLSVFTGEGSSLDIPVRAPRPEHDELPGFGPPRTAAPLPVQRLRVGSGSRRRRHDLTTGRLELVTEGDMGLTRQEANGLESGGRSWSTHSIVEGDPLSSFLEVRRALTVGRGEWQTRVETVSTWSSNSTDFHVTNVLEGYEADVRVFVKTWDCTVPRDLV